jgi:sugar phosphate isomerase/epimerase
MALRSGDLVFCAGNHLATPFLDRLSAASAAGYQGISILPYEVEVVRAQGMSIDDLRSRVADAGLEISELDAITTWLPGHAPPDHFPKELAAGLAGNTAENLCPLGGALGARSVNVVEFYGHQVDTDAAAEGFAHVCDVAAEHGLLAHLEFLPWAGVPDLTAAWQVVQRAGRPNGGLLVDSWHFFRSGSTLAQLRSIPGAAVNYVQIDDAPATPEADLSDETQHRRLLPGQGELDLGGLLRVLHEIGCDAPIGPEVFSDDLASQPVDAVARTVADATRRVIAAASAPA